MKRKKKVQNSVINYTEGTRNVFADLGLEDSEGLLARAKLGQTVRIILEGKNLKQKDISQILGIDQSEVSKLLNGKYNLFTQDRLYGFLNKLNQRVVVTYRTRQEDESPFDVIHA